MTIAISRSPALAPMRGSPTCSSAAMDLNSCRQEIERAAAAKISEAALTIRQCLLQAGVSTSQASNRTMQARVRREVQRLTQGRTRKTFSTGKEWVPREILVPRSGVSRSGSNGTDLDSYTTFADESFEDDNISVLTDPTYLQTCASRVPLHFTATAAATSSGTPRPAEPSMTPALPSLFMSTAGPTALPAAAFPMLDLALEAQKHPISLFPGATTTDLFVASGLVDAANDWMLKTPFEQPQFLADQGQDLARLPFAVTNTACISR